MVVIDEKDRLFLTTTSDWPFPRNRGTARASAEDAECLLSVHQHSSAQLRPPQGIAPLRRNSQKPFPLGIITSQHRLPFILLSILPLL